MTSRVLPDPVVLVCDREAARDQPREHSLDFLTLVIDYQEVPECAAAHCRSAVTRDALARAIEFHDAAMPVEHDDQATGGVDHGRVEVPLPLQRTLRIGLELLRAAVLDRV